MTQERVSITIITSTLNCREEFEKLAQSLRGQTLKKFQWIVADGGSTDGTLDAIQKYQDVVTDWWSAPDKGIYDAWNKACRKIRGEWVLFLGAGDLPFEPETLEKSARRLANARGPLFYGGVALIDQAGRIAQYFREVPASSWNEGRPTVPCHQGVFHHHSLLEGPDPFDSSFRICADAKLMLQASASSPPVYIGFDVTKMLLGGISSTPRAWAIMARENRRILRELNIKLPAKQWIPLLRLHIKIGLHHMLGKNIKIAANAYRRLTGRRPIY